MTITRTLIKEDQRLGTLPHYFGKGCFKFEMTVYSLCDHYLDKYHGGYWDFCRLSNNGFYMTLRSDKIFTFNNPDNYCCEQIDADTMSIIINLYALSHLSISNHDAPYTEFYFKLRDYAGEHKNASLIFKAID